jgi:hypothetical protein
MLNKSQNYDPVRYKWTHTEKTNYIQEWFYKGMYYALITSVVNSWTAQIQNAFSKETSHNML